jgi:hypothetical protein
MDQQQKQNINQAAEQLTDSTQQVFRTLADRTVALQERNLSLTQNFYKNWIERVHNQAQGTREATQTLRDQGQRQREAVETLSQEATNAYSEFLNSALSFYQEAFSTASQVAQSNIESTTQFAQQGLQAGVQAASQATQASTQVGQQAAEFANQSAQNSARAGEQFARSGALAAQRVATGVPIPDYDNLNVSEIAEQLENLSTDELQHVRTYEQQNKNRDTLLEQIDRRIYATA